MVEGVNGAKKQVPLNQDSTNVKKDVIIKKSIKTPIDFKYSAGNTDNTANKPIDIDPDALKKIADELGYKLDKPIGIDPNALKKIADEFLAARNKLKEPGDDNIGSRLIDPGFEIPVNYPDDPGFKPVKDPLAKLFPNEPKLPDGPVAGSIDDPGPKPVKDDPLPLPADIRAKLHPNTPKLTGANKPKEPKGPLTAGEIDYARKIGADVADFLVGYTNDFEQEQTILRLRDSVTNRNVMEFLSGYEANKGRGDHFFTQLATEYGFEDKQKYMQNVAGKLSAYLKANGQPDLAKEIEVALVDGSISKSEAAKLDEIVQVMLPTMQDLKQE